MTTVVKLIFWVLIPAIIIYYRTQKKFKTGFAIGFVLTSLLLGVLVSASMQTSPFDAFMKHMNSNNYEEAEKDLRIILQRNPDDIQLIDESEIINRVKYERIKKKLYREYVDIAENNLEEVPLEYDENCRNIERVEKNHFALQHALRLAGMAEVLGPEKKDLKKKIIKKRNRVKKVLERMDDKCR